MQIFAIVVSLAIAAVGITLFVKAIRTIIATLKIGQPAVGRSDDKAARWTNMLKETLGHTRMLQWTAVGIGHWFVFIGFGLLFFTLLTAFGQLFDAHFALPLIGHWFVYEWVVELITLADAGRDRGLHRLPGLPAPRARPRQQGPVLRLHDVAGRTSSRRSSSASALCILVLRGAEYALAQSPATRPRALHFPLTFFVGEAFAGCRARPLDHRRSTWSRCSRSSSRSPG